MNKSNSIHPNTWRTYFKTLLNNNSGKKSTNEIKNKLFRMENDIKAKVGPLDEGFLEQEILKDIKRLKSSKFYFGVTCDEMLKCNPKAVSRVLCKLFNCILKTKIFPEKWNLSLIKPLLKSGTMSKHDNYRGICISNHLSKFFTSLLDKRLQL